jgi:hypothetical protein
MATTYRVLGQTAPAATTLTSLYVVSTGVKAVISTIVVANRSSTAATFRLAVRPNGAALANQHYLAYDVPIAGNDSTTLTIGITLDQDDVISVYGSTANLSWNAFGTEII